MSLASSSACHRPELEFVRLASQDVRSENVSPRLRELSQQPLPWNELERTAAKHGLSGLWAAWLETPAAASWPEAFREYLNAESAQILKHNLQLLALLKQVGERLQSDGTPYVVIKGPIQAARLYGNLSLRPSHDLDLLIHPQHQLKVSALMREMGFQPQFEFNSAEMLSFQRQEYALSFQRERDGLSLDLHTHLVRPSFSFRAPVETLFEKVRRVTVSGLEVPVLDAPTELNFLVWHAAKHNWERWIWIRDLDATARGLSESEWSEVERQVSDWGGRNVLGTSMELARRFFETPLLASLQPSGKALQLAMENLERLEQSRTFRLDGPLRTALEPGEGRRYLTRLLFEPGPADWAWVRLPMALRGLYFPLRPLRLFLKRVWG